jgi:hypothetical protein
VGFCVAVFIVKPLALIVGLPMIAFAIGVAIWSAWMAWKPGSKEFDGRALVVALALGAVIVLWLFATSSPHKHGSHTTSDDEPELHMDYNDE